MVIKENVMKNIEKEQTVRIFQLEEQLTRGSLTSEQRHQVRFTAVHCQGTSSDIQKGIIVSYQGTVSNRSSHNVSFHHRLHQ